MTSCVFDKVSLLHRLLFLAVLYVLNDAGNMKEEFSTFPHLVASLSCSVWEHLFSLRIFFEHPHEYLHPPFTWIA